MYTSFATVTFLIFKLSNSITHFLSFWLNPFLLETTKENANQAITVNLRHKQTDPTTKIQRSRNAIKQRFHQALIQRKRRQALVQISTISKTAMMKMISLLSPK